MGRKNNFMGGWDHFGLSTLPEMMKTKRRGGSIGDSMVASNMRDIKGDDWSDYYDSWKNGI